MRKRWIADRVELSLNFQVIEEAGGDGACSTRVFVPATSNRPNSETVPYPFHNVRIEFRLSRRTGAGGHPPEIRNGAASLPAPEVSVPMGAEADEVVQILSGLFGKPGFDSSARASVFREALEGLSPGQSTRAIQSLRESPSASQAEPAVRKAAHSLRLILANGPAKSVDRGADLLAQLLTRYSLPVLLRLIADRWKSQQQWLDESE